MFVRPCVYVCVAIVCLISPLPLHVSRNESLKINSQSECFLFKRHEVDQCRRRTVKGHTNLTPISAAPKWSRCSLCKGQNGQASYFQMVLFTCDGNKLTIVPIFYNPCIFTVWVIMKWQQWNDVFCYRSVLSNIHILFCLPQFQRLGNYMLLQVNSFTPLLWWDYK